MAPDYMEAVAAKSDRPFNLSTDLQRPHWVALSIIQEEGNRLSSWEVVC